MYIKHSNVASGQYTLQPNKSIENFLQELVGRLFGECEMFNIYHYHNHIKFNILI